METESENEGQGRKRWIVFCLICFVVLVFVMVKSLIFNSPDKELFPEADLKSKNLIPSSNPATANQANQTNQQAPETPRQNSEPTPPPTTADTEPDATTTIKPAITDKFITYSPTKVADIKKISKFRSCAEKAFGTTSFQDQDEPKSSLKHYFKLKTENTSVYAPFDGKIIAKSIDKLIIETNPFNGWLINISGLIPKNGLDVDSEIKAGDEIGKSSGNKIEISVSGFNESQKGKSSSNYTEKNLDSIFSHLNESVSSEFSSKGITSDNIIIPKSDRDAQKCEFETSNDEDWEKLE